MTSKENNIIIGIDTSCYTTSIAAISLDRQIILNKKIMLKVDKDSKGLRQSEAVFQHVKNLGKISEDIKDKLKNHNIVGVCASKNPRPTANSYMPVFTVGENFAKLLASINNCSYFETTHQENHIESSLFNLNLKNKEKFIAVHMSGGTTEIILISKNNTNYNLEIIGGTKDISVGQLIDRIGVKLSYDFPCGSHIDRKACDFNGKIEKGIKTSVKEGFMNLSGIENQINKIIDNEYYKGMEDYLSKLLMDTIVRCMTKAIEYLSNKYLIDEVVFAGGVSASKYISKELTIRLEKKKIKSYFTEPSLATDNAVGCALIGIEKLQLGE